MSVLLRAAEPVDAEDVAEVLLASRKEFLPFAPSVHTDDEVRAWARDVLLPTGGVTVAVLEGRVVGVLAVSLSEGASWIDQLYIHPAHVGEGIGSRLLAHAVATSPSPIRLYAFQQNGIARRFFERNGFVAIRFSDGLSNEERCPDVLYELAR